MEFFLLDKYLLSTQNRVRVHEYHHGFSQERLHVVNREYRSSIIFLEMKFSDFKFSIVSQVKQHSTQNREEKGEVKESPIFPVEDVEELFFILRLTKVGTERVLSPVLTNTKIRIIVSYIYTVLYSSSGIASFRSSFLCLLLTESTNLSTVFMLLEALAGIREICIRVG